MTGKRTSFDYSLPSSFLALLNLPVSQVVNSLLPYDTSHKAPTSLDNKNAPSAPFLDAMRSIPDTLTEKGALAHSTTKSALVDLFYEMTSGVQATRLFELLDTAWKDDPESTLQIIFHTRSIHEGKGNEEVFFRAMAWVWEKHPRTMLENLHLITDPTCKRQRSQKRDAEKAQRATYETNAANRIKSQTGEGDPEYPARPHGAFKDLINLMILYINGQLKTSHTKRFSALNESLAPAAQVHSFKANRIARKANTSVERDRDGFVTIAKHLGTLKKKRKAGQMSDTDDEPLDLFKAQLSRCPTSNLAIPLRTSSCYALAVIEKAKQLLFAHRLQTMLQQDSKFRAFYVVVANIFVDSLRRDLEKLRDHVNKPRAKAAGLRSGDSPHLFGISYAAKWIPSPAKGADRQLHFATAIAAILFPNELSVDLQREKLQREVLAPLRKVTKVPETRMGQGLWTIDYTKVPSRSMSRNAKQFQIHDPHGFARFLSEVTGGRYAISGASMFPHELVIDSMTQDSPITARMANLQWKSLVDSVRSSSADQLSDCLAIADVSGSMGRLQAGANKKEPAHISVCVALTLLLGELSQSPWNGSFFTFSSNPTFETIDTSLDLSDRVARLSRAHWEMSTNFYKVFDLILVTAQRQKLVPEQMVKKLFVFSDMQFDQASDNKFGETEHMVVKRKFEAAGYPMPQMVYWNLAGRYDSVQPTSKPVQADVEGVSLVSGYSGALMKYFLGVQGNSAGAETEDEASDDGWETIEGKGKTAVEGNEHKKRKVDPLQTVKSILSAESFQGVKVVD